MGQGPVIAAPTDATLNLVAKQDPVRTRISRVVFSQEIRQVVPPAPFRRHLQVIIPPGAVVYLADDLPTEPGPGGFAPDGLPGRNRVYKLPTLGQDQQIELQLASGQWLVGAVKKGQAAVTFIIQPTDPAE